MGIGQHTRAGTALQSRQRPRLEPEDERFAAVYLLEKLLPLRRAEQGARRAVEAGDDQRGEEEGSTRPQKGRQARTSPEQPAPCQHERDLQSNKGLDRCRAFESSGRQVISEGKGIEGHAGQYQQNARDQSGSESGNIAPFVGGIYQWCLGTT